MHAVVGMWDMDLALKEGQDEALPRVMVTRPLIDMSVRCPARTSPRRSTRRRVVKRSLC